MTFRLTPLTGKAPKEQKRLLLAALEQAEGSPTEAARGLGVSRVWFAKQMKAHNIKGPRAQKEQRR